MSGSTRGLREGRYDSRIEAHRETAGIATDIYNHCTEVLLYNWLLLVTNQDATPYSLITIEAQGHILTGCCLNRYFVSANSGEYFLFFESGSTAVQPLIAAWR